jgi:hypothetical protein
VDTTPGGLSDVQFGFKAALLADPDRYLTIQFRTYVPTGNPGTGLGTGHPSLEPSREVTRVCPQGILTPSGPTPYCP